MSSTYQTKATMHTRALAVLEDIQRTGQLIEEFRRLKKNGGSRAELERLRMEIQRLKKAQQAFLGTSAHRKGDHTATRGDASGVACTNSRGGAASQTHSRGEYNTKASRELYSHSSPTRHSVSGSGAGKLNSIESNHHYSRQVSKEEPLTEPGQSMYHNSTGDVRRYTSTVLAIVLAEAHTRREILHKCDKKRLKIAAAYREGKVLIAHSHNKTHTTGGTTTEALQQLLHNILEHNQEKSTRQEGNMQYNRHQPDTQPGATIRKTAEPLPDKEKKKRENERITTEKHYDDTRKRGKKDNQEKGKTARQEKASQTTKDMVYTTDITHNIKQDNAKAVQHPDHIRTKEKTESEDSNAKANEKHKNENMTYKEQERLDAEHRARLKAEEEARLKAEEEARLKAEEEARLKAEEEARLKAEEEARLKAEEEARLKAEEEARLKAEEEARLKAEEEARLKAEEEARLKAEEEARLKAEEEARLKAEEEARLKAEEEARLKAEEEARLKAEEEARLKAEEEARLKAEEEARLKAEEEARLKAEEEARLKAEEEARLKAEEEARLKAEEEARLKAEEEARLKAEEEARLKAEEEARLKAEEEARLKAEEEARLKAEEEARLKAEEEARLKAEEEARLKAEEEARLKAEEEASPSHG
uniref:Kinetoplast-associated protein n=1 Tax=Trypanosoma congolense (strain IL3000) TaxID=1068625 RepID=G0UQX7_TRYCI|nr:conserved hypothetical protein [Trypanosoma congolense IL3000]